MLGNSCESPSWKISLDFTWLGWARVGIADRAYGAKAKAGRRSGGCAPVKHPVGGPRKAVGSPARKSAKPPLSKAVGVPGVFRRPPLIGSAPDLERCLIASAVAGLREPPA